MQRLATTITPVDLGSLRKLTIELMELFVGMFAVFFLSRPQAPANLPCCRASRPAGPGPSPARGPAHFRGSRSGPEAGAGPRPGARGRFLEHFLVV